MKFTKGQIVEHPTRPEWGPGKVLGVLHDKVTVYWRDLPETKPGERVKTICTSVVGLTLAPEQTDPWLDNLPPMIDEKGVVVPAKVTKLGHRQAIKLFLAKYPGGFHDPQYLQDERDYKWKAHEAFIELLGNGQLESLATEDLPEAIRRLQSLESKTNLLAVPEKAAFRDALKSEEEAQTYLLALAKMLKTPGEPAFTDYAESIERLPAEGSRVDGWPVATIFLFLADPERLMFLKPTITRLAAERVAFSLNYQPALNWLTYDKLLELSSLLLDQLRSHGARDFIDVQSFMWLTAQ